RLDPDTFQARKVGVGRRHHALGEPVMVAQVDEKQAAKVALAVDPAGKTGLIAHVLRTQLAAGMRPVGVHGGKTPAFPVESGVFGLPRSAGQAHVAVKLVNIGYTADSGAVLETLDLNDDETGEIRLITESDELAKACETLAR